MLSFRQKKKKSGSRQPSHRVNYLCTLANIKCTFDLENEDRKIRRGVTLFTIRRSCRRICQKAGVRPGATGAGELPAELPGELPGGCPGRAAGSRGDCLPSSWWNGSFSGFSSRDFSTPWVGGRKVGLTGRGLAIFSIFREGHLKSQSWRRRGRCSPPEKHARTTSRVDPVGGGGEISRRDARF